MAHSVNTGEIRNFFNCSRAETKAVQDAGTARPSKALNITAVVVGTLALAILGAIGVAGFLQASGLVTLPAASFGWVAGLGTVGHSGMIAGAAAGLVMMAIGAHKVHTLRKLEATEETEDENPKLTKADVSKMMQSVLSTSVNLSNGKSLDLKGLQKGNFLQITDNETTTIYVCLQSQKNEDLEYYCITTSPQNIYGIIAVLTNTPESGFGCTQVYLQS